MQTTAAIAGTDVVLRGITVADAQRTPPENAHLTGDYPWGYKLRTVRATWVEVASKGAVKGQSRLVTCTRDPKRPGNPWCKPKAGIYSDLIVPFLDAENGHLSHDALTINGWPADFVRFFARWGDHLTDDQARRYNAMLARSRRLNPTSWSEHDAKVAESLGEAAAIFRGNRPLFGEK